MKKDNIEVLLSMIEQKLGWGDSSLWSSYDFDKLATLIFDSTKTAISSNTLKRIWGRVKYDSKPSDVTLNTLAKFIGHIDYREFISELNTGSEIFSRETEQKPWFKWPPFQASPSVIFASGAIFMLVAIITLSYNTLETKYDPDDFYFTSRKITKGLPNSVIFEYRAQVVSSDAIVEIQQSWDDNKRQTISKSDSLATAIYYDPGYFKAKLVVDGQVVKEHGVLIPSEGWKAKIESSKSALYFSDSSVTDGSKIAISSKLLQDNGIESESNLVKTNFRYVDDFGNLRANNLYLETKFRNTSKNGLNVCQKSSVTLLMEGEAISIPLSKMGCISELDLYHLNENLSGKNNDLSKFGVDFEDWVTLRCTFKNDWLEVFINDEKAITLPMKGRINKMHGLVYSFEGSGEVKSLLLKTHKKVYFEYPSL
ncbi:MAG: hypothetical protein AB8B56_12095 [Crocinitomicaceae bacterium]